MIQPNFPTKIDGIVVESLAFGSPTEMTYETEINALKLITSIHAN